MRTKEDRKVKLDKIRKKILKKSKLPFVDEDYGEVLCNKCNGLGIIQNCNGFSTKCDKCDGVGKLDWIEQIVGKNKPQEPDYTFSSYSLCSSFSVSVGAGGGGSIGGSGFSNGSLSIPTNYYIKEESIDPEFIKGIENKIREQILKDIDQIVEMKVNKELINRGVKILDDN